MTVINDVSYAKLISQLFNCFVQITLAIEIFTGHYTIWHWCSVHTEHVFALKNAGEGMGKTPKGHFQCKYALGRVWPLRLCLESFPAFVTGRTTFLKCCAQVSSPFKTHLNVFSVKECVLCEWPQFGWNYNLNAAFLEFCVVRGMCVRVRKNNAKRSVSTVTDCWDWPVHFSILKCGV